MYYCFVCGAPTENPPWGEDGRSPLFEICPCCGCEHGYQDASIKGIENHRNMWLADGANWCEPELKPANLSLEEQLSKIPKELPIGIQRSR